jgi:hypothetical protein
MPNWCYNRLTVTGPVADVDNLRSRVVGAPVDNLELFNSLLPMPSDLEETSTLNNGLSVEQRAYLQQTYGADNWYDWATGPQGWGSKWGDCDTTELSYGPGLVVFTFDSAWGPPEEGLYNVSAIFPSLVFTIEYAEPGMAFSGSMVIREGLAVSEDARGTYDSEFALELSLDEDEDF